MAVRTTVGEWRRAAGLIAVAALLGAVAGCSMQLETGYTYRPLNASATQRRAYYAPAFSPEKSAAEHEKSSGGNAGPSFGGGNAR